MNLDEYLVTLTADGARIADIGDVALDARVPTCPDWRIADLIVHVGWVHHMLAHLAGVPDGGRATRKDSPELRAIVAKAVSAERPDEDLLGWFRHGVADLCRELSEADPTKTITTYLGTHQPLLLARRAATETAVHRRDAETAVGQPEGLAHALAAEAIEEFLDKMVPVFFKHADFAGTGQRICLEGVDRSDTWLVTVTADKTVVRRDPSASGVDVTARGSLSDLYLFLWGREPAEPIEVTGDRDLLTRWQTAAAF